MFHLVDNETLTTNIDKMAKMLLYDSLNESFINSGLFHSTWIEINQWFLILDSIAVKCLSVIRLYNNSLKYDVAQVIIHTILQFLQASKIKQMAH